MRQNAVALLIGGALAGGAFTVHLQLSSPVSAELAEASPRTTVYTEEVIERIPMPGDMEIVLFADGGHSVGRSGSNVVTTETVDWALGEVEYVSTLVPSATEDDDSFRLAGWTPELVGSLSAQLLAGVDVPTAIAGIELQRQQNASEFNTTAADPDEYVNANCQAFGAQDGATYGGCFGTKRGYRTSSQDLYRGDEYFGYIRGKGILFGREVGAGFTYENSVVFKANPTSTISQGECKTRTFGAGVSHGPFSLNVSQSGTACPEKLAPTSGPNLHLVSWYGVTIDQKSTLGVNISRTPGGLQRGQQFTTKARFGPGTGINCPVDKYYPCKGLLQPW